MKRRFKKPVSQGFGDSTTSTIEQAPPEEEILDVEEGSPEGFVPTVSRECGDCNLCCQGWLYAEIFDDVTLTYGSPCHYVGCNGCTVYEQRPYNPCQTYKCVWLKDGLLPEWFKPNKSNLICTWRRWKNNGVLEDYIDVAECGETIKAKHLRWLLDLSQKKGINIAYTVEGKRYCEGSNEFLKWYAEDFEWL